VRQTWSLAVVEHRDAFDEETVRQVREQRHPVLGDGDSRDRRTCPSPIPDSDPKCRAELAVERSVRKCTAKRSERSATR
jgi:hypothetical protein